MESHSNFRPRVQYQSTPSKDLFQSTCINKEKLLFENDFLRGNNEVVPRRKIPTSQPRLSTAHSAVSGRLHYASIVPCPISSPHHPKPVTLLASLRLPPTATRAGLLVFVLGLASEIYERPTQGKKHAGRVNDERTSVAKERRHYRGKQT